MDPLRIGNSSRFFPPEIAGVKGVGVMKHTISSNPLENAQATVRVAVGVSTYDDVWCVSQHFQATRWHVNLEAWMGYPLDFKYIQTTYPTMAPKDLGSFGYEGLSTTYIPKPPQQKAYASSGTALQFYRNWNVSWNQPWEYFGSTSSVNSSLLMPCTKTILNDDGAMRRHVAFTSDVDGVVITNAPWWIWKKLSQSKYY